MITVFESENHKNVMFNALGTGNMIQANQNVIVHEDECMILDPGGHKIHTRLFAELSAIVPVNRIRHIFFSHQDPDIVAAANAWLMMTDAKAYLPSIWTRFVAHFGVDELSAKRVEKIPDSGMTMSVGGAPMKIIPAHFLHSSGNFNVYDTVSKILYSGDIGASPAAEYSVVEDFDDHVRFLEGFHTRYMPSTKAVKMWVKMVEGLDIRKIVPQHGAMFDSPETAGRFVEWFGALTVGADLLGDAYAVPE